MFTNVPRANGPPFLGKNDTYLGGVQFFEGLTEIFCHGVQFNEGNLNTLTYI